ncbi:hypothetical protein D3C85_1347490 [compost metagenome]
MHAEIGAAHTGPGELFVEHRAVAEITTTATVFGGQGDAEQTFATGLEPGFAVDLTGLVPLGLTRQAFTLEETSHGSTEHFMVVAENGSGDVHARLLIDGRPAVGRAPVNEAYDRWGASDERHPRWVAGWKFNDPGTEIQSLLIAFPL